jgi:catechol 2,3-dioxygenase-like lactoylglutathione lyase family enzyme
MFADRVTANLPSSDFDRTAEFYGSLGFEPVFRAEGWMILRSGPLEIEFFAMKQKPETSWFSACVRVRDLDSLHERYSRAGLPQTSVPRLTSPEPDSGLRMFALVDVDGSLLRCIEIQE